MKVINASAELYLPSKAGSGQKLTREDGQDILKSIEAIGRVCYKSEGRITDGSAEDFVRSLISRGHTSVLEHMAVSALVVCDRGVTHEIVRHRIGAYAQESTRYCNYSADKYGNEITVIDPGTAFGWSYVTDGMGKHNAWLRACEVAEREYLSMMSEGASPQEARSVLPNSTKTEIWMTYDLREWRHFLSLRTSRAAHPQMREVADLLLAKISDRIPIVFDDIYLERFGGETDR